MMYHPPSSSPPSVIASPSRNKRRPSDAMPGDDKPGKKRRGSQYGQGHAPDHVSGGSGASEDLLGGAVDNPGAKHWSDEEKTKFFIWLLGSDEHWEQFGTKMNTCFREVREMNILSFFPLAPPSPPQLPKSVHHNCTPILPFHIRCMWLGCAVIRLTLFVAIGLSKFPLVQNPLKCRKN